MDVLTDICISGFSIISSSLASVSCYNIWQLEIVKNKKKIPRNRVCQNFFYWLINKRNAKSSCCITLFSSLTYKLILSSSVVDGSSWKYKSCWMPFVYFTDFSVDWWALGVLMFEMLAGRSPFDIVGQTDNPDQNTEDYLFQGESGLAVHGAPTQKIHHILFRLKQYPPALSERRLPNFIMHVFFSAEPKGSTCLLLAFWFIKKVPALKGLKDSILKFTVVILHD